MTQKLYQNNTTWIHFPQKSEKIKKFPCALCTSRKINMAASIARYFSKTHYAVFSASRRRISTSTDKTGTVLS